MVANGMTVELGTGSTAAYLLPALAERRLELRCVASSPATERMARELGIEVQSFRGSEAPAPGRGDRRRRSGHASLVKGGGAAHSREKALAAAAERFVVIEQGGGAALAASSPRAAGVWSRGHPRAALPARVRAVPHSPDGGVIADYLGEIDDVEALARRLSTTTGVAERRDVN